MALHEKGWGCRKIAATLRCEGVDTSKDKVWRMIKEHEVKGIGAEVEQDRGFKRLKQQEGVLQKRLDVQRKKEEYRRRMVNLIVELVMTSYQARRELFLDERKMLKFAERIMPFVDAQLWTDFKRPCELYDWDLAHHLSEAVGLQRHFEEQFADDSGEKLRLDAYLGKKIREALTAWNETEEDEQEPEEGERCADKEDAETEVTGWVDAEGYYNILLPRASDDEGSVV
jgi:hypothetical protein